MKTLYKTLIAVVALIVTVPAYSSNAEKVCVSKHRFIKYMTSSRVRECQAAIQLDIQETNQAADKAQATIDELKALLKVAEKDLEDATTPVVETVTFNDVTVDFTKADKYINLVNLYGDELVGVGTTPYKVNTVRKAIDLQRLLTVNPVEMIDVDGVDVQAQAAVDYLLQCLELGVKEVEFKGSMKSVTDLIAIVSEQIGGEAAEVLDK